ncbi:helix-turn-helix domain-containing protein [uncultured Enterococcus sp.]|uniref:helix-turn-helix domain-containing protein n=1 Tax=uncultured Enterococcus sp. TaxID=167972 RepID=UPI002582BA1D|nr:helix-turn-helix domain-containing protein [uncultured Enterococcus sp.]
MLERLISEREKNKLDLFRYLESRFGTSIKLAEIEAALGYTHYLTKQLTKELSEDAKKLTVDDSFELSIMKEELIFEQAAYVSSNILEELYLEESQEMKLLKSIFFETFKSKKSYADENYLSRTSVYRLFDRVAEQLAEFGLFIDSKGKISGNELEIRDFFSTLFYKVYKNDCSFYSTAAQTNFILLEAHLRKEISDYTTSIQFQHYVLVSSVRLQTSRRYLDSSEQIPLIIKNEKLLESCVSWIKALGVSPSKATHEAFGILANIQHINFKKTGIHRDYSLCKEFSARLFSELHKRIDFSLEKYQSEMEAINEVFFDYYYIDLFKDILIRDIDLTYFKENFPEFFYGCLDFIKKQFGQELDSSFNKVGLFFDLLLSVIRMIPYKKIREQINVYVHFLQGTSYNTFIKSNVDMFSYYNFHFQESLRPDTDLILSDYVIAPDDIAKTIIWLSPPRAKDWEAFGEKVITIAAEKYARQSEKD